MPLLESWTVERTHSGPNQAGNKSLLSYNSAIGIPGYTGFCSTASAVTLPIKCAEHTGKPVSDATHHATVKGTVSKAATSEYATTFRKAPGDTVRSGRTGGGYWIMSQPLIQSPPFRATTTYKQELTDGAVTSAAQLERTIGLPCTLASYEAARLTAPRRSQSVEPGPLEPQVSRSVRPATMPLTNSTRRPDCVMTPAGELVGYQTTNQAAQTARSLGITSKLATATRGDKLPAQEVTRYTAMPAAMPPTMYGSQSTYHRDFGADGEDPMARSAPSERFQTRCTSSQDLSVGTSRATNNPPGYTGHIAASKHNALAMAQSAAADERVDQKSDMLLYGLDQYGRTRLPGFTGYKPQAARNISIVPPRPTKATTSGAAAAQGVKYGVPRIDNTHYINSRAGILTFFTSAGPYVSDNGLTNAQEYFKLVKPGNDFHHSGLPRVTHYGKRFDNRNSLV